jgi:hypothetical protein
MNDTTISQQDIRNVARVVADSMPEYLALQQTLLAESPQVRRAVATVLQDWAFDPLTDMSPEEQEAFLVSVKAELARRGASVPGEA